MGQGGKVKGGKGGEKWSNSGYFARYTQQDVLVGWMQDMSKEKESKITSGFLA